MRLVVIAAMSENGVIGRDGGLPWHLPEDLRRFKRLTSGHPVIMGRRTYEEVGGPLADRANIVLTTREGWSAKGVQVARDLASAIRLAVMHGETVFIIGGGEVYRQAMPVADALHLTRVHANVRGDASFPAVDWSVWRLVNREPHPADDRHEFAFTFEDYERV